jgi:hypothetical protein
MEEDADLRLLQSRYSSDSENDGKVAAGEASQAGSKQASLSNGGLLPPASPSDCLQPVQGGVLIPEGAQEEEEEEEDSDDVYEEDDYDEIAAVIEWEEMREGRSCICLQQGRTLDSV